jgi:GT2 family glycosyltransferase
MTKTCCVIVTYSNRFHLLNQVLSALQKQPVDYVIIVDNASNIQSRKSLDEFLKKFSIKTEVITFNKNEGSAKGFGTGIKAAIKTDCEFLWCLDDDNLPLDNSLNLLHKTWEEFDLKNKETNLALLSNREDRLEFINAVNKQNPEIVLPPMNSFLGFSIFSIAKKIKERIFTQKVISGKYKKGIVKVAPYGGLFLNKKALNDQKLPNEDYFLYLDDFDFTLKLSNNGCNIWMIVESKIKDIEQSSYITKKKKILYHSIFDAKKDFVVYYANRNLCFLQRENLITNPFIYYLNKYLFVIYITTLGTIRLKTNRLKILFEAIKDAENNNLGENKKYLI